MLQYQRTTLTVSKDALEFAHRLPRLWHAGTLRFQDGSAFREPPVRKSERYMQCAGVVVGPMTSCPKGEDGLRVPVPLRRDRHC